VREGDGRSKQAKGAGKGIKWGVLCVEAGDFLHGGTKEGTCVYRNRKQKRSKRPGRR